MWQKDGRSADKFYFYAHAEGDYMYCFEKQTHVYMMKVSLDVVTNHEYHARKGEIVKGGECFLERLHSEQATSRQLQSRHYAAIQTAPL